MIAVSENQFTAVAEAARAAYAAKQDADKQAAAEKMAQEQAENQARFNAEKAAFIADLTTLWHKLTGADPVIDDDDIVHVVGSGFYWRAAPGIEFDIRNGRHPGEKNLHLTNLPYSTRSKIGSLADLGEALEALADRRQQLADQKTKEAQHAQKEQDRQRRQEEADARRAEIEAREPAALQPTTVFCDGGGIHVKPNGMESLTLCPFLVPEYDEGYRPVAGRLLEFTFTRSAVQALLDGLNLSHGALHVDARYRDHFVVARPGSLTWFRLPQGYSTEWDDREELTGAVVQQEWPIIVDAPPPAWVKALKAALREWLVCCQEYDTWCQELAGVDIVD